VLSFSTPILRKLLALRCFGGAPGMETPTGRFVAGDDQASGLSKILKPLGTSLPRMWCWPANSILRRRRFTLRRSFPLRSKVIQHKGQILIEGSNGRHRQLSLNRLIHRMRNIVCSAAHADVFLHFFD
jgi:hypothetical protein